MSIPGLNKFNQAAVQQAIANTGINPDNPNLSDFDKLRLLSEAGHLDKMLKGTTQSIMDANGLQQRDSLPPLPNPDNGANAGMPLPGQTSSDSIPPDPKNVFQARATAQNQAKLINGVDTRP